MEQVRKLRLEQLQRCCEMATYARLQLLVTYPPFSHRRERRDHASHDHLTKTEMKALGNITDSTASGGGHIVVFCNPLQFSHWYSYFIALETEDQIFSFHVDLSPLTVMNTSGYYHGTFRKKTTALQYITLWAVHATKSGVSIA